MSGEHASLEADVRRRRARSFEVHGRQGQIHFSGRDHRHHRVRRQRGRHLSSTSACAPTSSPRWLSAFVVGWPVAAVTAFIALPFARSRDAAHRRPDRGSGVMLQALDLARRIDAGELTPRRRRRSLRQGDRGARDARSAPSRRSTSTRARARRRRRGLAARAAARAAGRREGHLRHRRFPDRIRLADLRRATGRAPTPRWSR